MRRDPRAARRDDRGAVAVEFALILPVLVALVMGIFAIGRAYNMMIELTGAVREGARALALGKSAAEAQAAVANAAPGVTGITYSGVTSCPPASTGNSQITATRPFTLNFYLYSPTVSLSATGRMRCGV